MANEESSKINYGKGIVPKHLIFINGVKMDLGNDIDIEYDLDFTYYFGSFNLPDVNKLNINKSTKTILNDIKFLDSIIIYYGEFSTRDEANSADYNNMTKIVDGYISDVIANETRDGALDRTIEFKSMMGLAYENPLRFDIIITDCATTILSALLGIGLIVDSTAALESYQDAVILAQNTSPTKIGNKYVYTFNTQQSLVEENNELFDNLKLTDNYVEFKKRDAFIDKIIFDEFTHDKNFIVKANTTTNVGEAFDSIKKNHAVKIFQTPDGTLNIVTPGYFYANNITAIDFDVKTTIQNINFGGLNNIYNAVVVYGTGCVGFAFDPISYELALPQAVKNSKTPITGVDADGNFTYKSGFTPDLRYLNYKSLFRRNIENPFVAYNTAINELYEISKNAKISFNTIFSAKIYPGRFFRINNSQYLRNLLLKSFDYDEVVAQAKANEQIWIIKNVKVKISKNDIGCTVIGYKNAIVDIPAELIIPNNGDGMSILDINLLSGLSKSANDIVLH